MDHGVVLDLRSFSPQRTHLLERAMSAEVDALIAEADAAERAVKTDDNE